MILNRKKHGVTDKHIIVTREYFKLLESLKNSNNFNINARYLISCNEEACMELYRHCLCIALNLDSKLAYTILNCFIDTVSTYLRNILQGIGVVNESVEFKKGFIEACMHCIVMSRNYARGEVL